MLRRIRDWLQSEEWHASVPYVCLIFAGIALASSLARHTPQYQSTYAETGTPSDQRLSIIEILALLMNGIMATATIGLYIVTRIAADAAKTAATAAMSQAKTADRTLTGLETPFLYPVVKADDTKESFKLFVLYDHPSSPADDKCTPGVSFRIKNFGRTPALLRSVAVEFEHLTEMVPSPRYDPLVDYAVEPVLEAHKETTRTFKRYLVLPVDKETFKSIQAGHSRMFLHGECIFIDIFGAEYFQTFCLAWDWRSKGFIPWGRCYNRRQRKEDAASSD